jgi:recombination protein U
MTVWKTRGKRGDALEDLILFSNDYYLSQGIARVDKAATPVTVVELDGKGLITKAYFEKKATIDFYGIVQGIFITFDAKETNQKSLPLKNIHEHQIDYMRDVTKQGGLAFLIVHFKHDHAYYLLSFEQLEEYYQKSLLGGRKSIPYSDMHTSFKISLEKNGTLGYLNAVNAYIDWKNTQSSALK